MIVGLGNPGRTYEDTRHNAGFMVLDRLAARWGAVFKADRQRKCEVAAGPGVLLVKPSTFMNESGLCVGPMMRFFKLDPRSVFVIHDEVDFPLGVIKLREKAPQAATTALNPSSPTWAPRNSRASVSASASPVAKGK